jgi:hypothetical protein
MKIVCACGKEHPLTDYHPEFLEVTSFVLFHGHDPEPPETVTAVCRCGARRVIGPGNVPEPRTSAQLLSQGMSDGQWLKSHARCEDAA